MHETCEHEWAVTGRAVTGPETPDDITERCTKCQAERTRPAREDE